MPDHRSNNRLALSLVAIVLGMGMLAYASVPLYRVFCQATGFGGVAEVSKTLPHTIINRTITVRFDANISSALDWKFKPLQKSVEIRPGEEKHIEYIAENLDDITTIGSATFNISPIKAGQYFNKLQCFCFTEQRLKPYEKKHLGVTFFIDPAINDDHDLDEVHTITLSYTFFPLQK